MQLRNNPVIYIQAAFNPLYSSQPAGTNRFSGETSSYDPLERFSQSFDPLQGHNRPTEAYGHTAKDRRLPEAYNQLSNRLPVTYDADRLLPDAYSANQMLTSVRGGQSSLVSKVSTITINPYTFRYVGPSHQLLRGLQFHE